MKILSLTINGQQVQSPSGLNTVNQVDIPHIIGYALDMLIFIAITFALIFLIWSGVQWILSGGDKQKVDAAKKRITLIIIGLVIVLGGVLILNLIGSVFGIDFTTVQFPS